MAGKPAKTTTKEVTVKVNVPPRDPRQKFDVAEAVKMRLRGLSYGEIAKVLNVDKSAVHKQIKRYAPDAIDVDVYKRNESDLIAALKSKFVNGITNEKISDMNAYQLTTMLAMMIDKSRLIDGKSTQNVQAIVTDLIGELNEES